MEIQKEMIAGLRSMIAGQVLLPGEPGYDESRTIWNAMFDKRPAIIVQSKTAGDVSRAVRFGRQNKLLIAVKGGGHNSAGNAVCDDGLVIDLSLMQGVKVDEGSMCVKVQGGCLLGTVDAATQEYGLAVSSGIISHTGVGGLTLGGGFGWISRKHGLSIDNLLSAEVVTADGNIVRTSSTEHPDLFWAIRGGGGNFGIVTEFEFKAAQIGKEVYTGPIVKRFEDLKEYMQFHRDFVRSLPDEMTVWLVVRHAPPLPFLPEDVHGKLVVLVPFVWLGDPAEGEKLIQPIREFGETLGDGSGLKQWTGWQSAFDGLVDHGARNYWKSHHIKSLQNDLIDSVRDFALSMPGQECEIFIPHMEGAPGQVPADATAFPHRTTPFVLNIHTRWRDASDDGKAIQWAKDFHKKTESFAEGVYVNFISSEGADRVKDAYTPHVWNKLVEAKNKWDPTNLFRMNQNIPPAD